MWCGDVQNHVFYQTEIFGIFSLAGGGDFAFSKREFPVNMTDVVDVGTTRSPQSPTFRQSQAPFLVAATPSSAISPDLTKRYQRTRHCDISHRSDARLTTQPRVETSSRPAPLQVDRPDPQGQRQHPSCRPLEDCRRTSSVVTMERRYDPRWLRDDDDDADYFRL